MGSGWVAPSVAPLKEILETKKIKFLSRTSQCIKGGKVEGTKGFLDLLGDFWGW